MSRRLPSVKPGELLRALKRAGYYVHHVTGSHHAMRHPGKPSVRVTVARHNKDLKRGTLREIIKKAGLTADEFMDLL